MLFDLKPKERLKDLYDRRDEYKELSRLIESGSWVCVLGKRMTGKTSLIKTFANEKKGVYINFLDTKGIEGFARKLLTQTGFDMSEIGVDLKFFHAKWSKVAEDAFGKLRKRVIVFDEIQNVASSPYFLKTLKTAWDTYHELKIVFSGSYIGLARNLLEPAEASPMYGRAPAVITLGLFSKQVSKSFLSAGLEEHPDIRVSDEQIDEVIDRLNGYVGWLTYYGNFRSVRRLSHEKSLSQTLHEGSKLISSELNSFLEKRQRKLYVKTLRMCINGTRWSELESELAVNSKVLWGVLNTLKSVNLLEESKEGYYSVDDPILKEAIKLL
ncbi:MAG: ATP-binding protein [archaeon]|nr:ATP-binding protein [archaeon]